MRASGYPGYSESGINSSAQVARRRKQQCTDIYGFASFTPAAIQKGINVKNKEKISIVQDKVATPPEPEKDIKA